MRHSPKKPVPPHGAWGTEDKAGIWSPGGKGRSGEPRGIMRKELGGWGRTWEWRGLGEIQQTNTSSENTQPPHVAHERQRVKRI